MRRCYLRICDTTYVYRGTTRSPGKRLVGLDFWCVCVLTYDVSLRCASHALVPAQFRRGPQQRRADSGRGMRVGQGRCVIGAWRGRRTDTQWLLWKLVTLSDVQQRRGACHISESLHTQMYLMRQRRTAYPRRVNSTSKLAATFGAVDALKSLVGR